MKKRVKKTKGAPASRTSRKGTATKKPVAKRPAAVSAAGSGGAMYTPPPLQGTGWPPFRYPLE